MNADASPEAVLGDLLAAAADDLGVALDVVDVRRLAPHLVELLDLCGYALTHCDPTT